MHEPRYIGHDLDETTQLYVDIHIAVELFHMRYPVYMAQTTPLERQLYQLYVALKSHKEEHVHWHAENDQKARQVARQAVDVNARP